MRFLIPALAAATALTACSQPAPSSEEAEARSVNLYTARHYSSDEAVYADFTAATGIEVNVLQASGDQLIERVRVDGERSPADIILTVDAARLHRAEEAGLFAVSDFSNIEGIAPNMVDPDGHWIAFASRARVIAYSNDRVEAGEITSYADLADPRWEGRICVRSSGNVYNQSLLAGMIAHEGEEAAEAWAAAIAANLARAPQGGDRDQLRGIAAGECDVAIKNHYYYAMMARSSDEADRAVAAASTLVFPNQDTTGTHVNISGAGIAANAPNAEEARIFIEYLLSADSQRKFVEMTNEFPVIADSQWDNDVIAGMLPFTADDIAIDALGENNAAAQRVFDRVDWP